jgi:hypothetical protein
MVETRRLLCNVGTVQTAEDAWSMGMAHRNRRMNVTATLLCSAALLSIWTAPTDANDADSLGQRFESDVRPLLIRYCQECHGATRAEAEINLAAMATWTGAEGHLETWQKVSEMLAGGLMPPKEAVGKPTDGERRLLLQWAEDYLAFKSTAINGYVSHVTLRRLSNAEYTYTIRDLTRVDALDPVSRFPVDGAAGEGFSNTGSALVMSPALLTKYLDAAKDVAGHAVLLPDGIRFSTHTTPRDWTTEILAEIRKFYSEYTEPLDAVALNLQGVEFTSHDGGRMPLKKYFAATLKERRSLEAESVTIETIARKYDLNAKYLGILWSSLNSSEMSLLLDGVRSRWRIARSDDAGALVDEITTWQKSLWNFSTVGHIGKLGGPKRWLEPVNPLATQQVIRFPIPETNPNEKVALSLVATDAGDGNTHDFVVWQRPRLVKPGRPDVLLKDVHEVANALKSGLDPVVFGSSSAGGDVDAHSLYVQAPSVVEITLPTEVAAGCELVTTGALESAKGAEGSVQLAIVAGKPKEQSGLVPSGATVVNSNAQWTDNNRLMAFSQPIVVAERSAARARFEEAFDEFRQLFPAALCYTQIVPVDEVVTLTLFHREDDHLIRLMLDKPQAEKLDRLWSELHYVSRDALKSVDAFAQLMEYATQDADPNVFEPLREPITARAAAFRQLLTDTEPKHIEAVLTFAEQAYRRPLSAAELENLRKLYDGLRRQDIAHEEAIRLALARVLIAPDFLYRIEIPSAGSDQSPLSPWELASRLSYFLWSTQPDLDLRKLAATGALRDTKILVAQTHRMLCDAKIRRLAVEFACQWLSIRDFDRFDEKSERHFPTFAALRDDMYEESVLFFTDLFQNNGSVLDILDADYTILNEDLAQHYGIPGIVGDHWRRVDGVKQYSRGGILAQATTLTRQSGASRTSPILRGNWVSEVLLGERLPNPPPGVPPLPADEIETDGMTIRELVEKHTSDEKCAVCHRRIDPYGFALEAFDAIGRRREQDIQVRPIDTHVTTIDGSQFDGLNGLRNHLLTTRRNAFLRQFCKKLLGYALGRAVQLADEPLLAEMQRELERNDYKFWSVVETIIRSSQFREIRGRDTTYGNKGDFHYDREEFPNDS